MPVRKDIVEKAWDCNEVDWDEYESHRPPYTEALYNLIFQHHETNGGQYDTALDVGAGGGTVTKVLLQKFQHVIFSDPSEEYNRRAEKRFQNEKEAGSITFLQRKFHEFNLENDLHGQQVDMITAGTCIHFGDAANLTTQLAPLLRPGGTFAAFSYGSVPIAPANDPAGPLIRKCKNKLMVWINDNISPVASSSGTGTGQSRYDNVAFDPALWKSVRRIQSMPNEHPWPEWIQPAEMRVREVEDKVVVKDGIIEKEVGYEFFPKYFVNFAPQLPLLEQIEEELEELRGVMGERRIVVRWPMMLVLGTRRWWTT